MRHRFEQREVPPGEKYVVERCIRCGHRRRRYASGPIVYPWGNKPCEPEGGEKEVQPEAAAEPLAKKADANEPAGKPGGATLEEYLARMKSYLRPVPGPEAPQLSDAEARLKEALVIINLLYEEMVAHGVRTRGREMAGRFLYSQGYGELKKHFDNRSNN